MEREVSTENVLLDLAGDVNLVRASKVMKTIIGEGFNEMAWHTLKSRIHRRMHYLERRGIDPSTIGSIILAIADKMLPQDNRRYELFFTTIKETHVKYRLNSC